MIKVAEFTPSNAEEKALSDPLVTVRVLKEYTYNLGDEGFQGYARRRGILRLAGEPGGRYWRFAANHQATQEKFDQDCRGYGEVRLTDEEAQVSWMVIVTIRGLLQYAWETWQQQSR